MTAQAEYRFRCDRCHTEENIDADNKPVDLRVPQGWLGLNVAGEPRRHLCADCTRDFTLFMDAPALKAAREEHEANVSLVA